MNISKTLAAISLACLIILTSAARIASGLEPVEVIIAPLASYAIGEYLIQPVNIPIGYASGYVKISRAYWIDANSRIEWSIDVSYDAGVSWQLLVGGASRGGVALDPVTQTAKPFSVIGATLAQPNNPNRRLRALIKIIGASATVSVIAGAT